MGGSIDLGRTEQSETSSRFACAVNVKKARKGLSLPFVSNVKRAQELGPRARWLANCAAFGFYTRSNESRSSKYGYMSMYRNFLQCCEKLQLLLIWCTSVLCTLS